MRKPWFRLVILGAVVIVAWWGWKGLDTLRIRGELHRARKEMAQGRLEPARIRLTALSAARPGVLGGEVDYWLGICESSQGRFERALAAFERVPAGFPFDAQAAALEAEANLRRGRLRPAERRLEEGLRRGGAGLNDLRRLLSRVYEIQLRVADAIPLYRESLEEIPDPLPLMRHVSYLDGGTLPLESLRETLEEAARLAPDDDRVWLGQARLAMQTGDWDGAERWLRRCRQQGADVPVWEAWLGWAQGTGRPAEALEAVEALGPQRFSPRQREALCAWFARQAGDARAEREAIERWLVLEPRSIAALERASVLALEEGNAAAAAAFRRQKAEADRALDLYRVRVRLGEAATFQSAAARIEAARLAEAAGRDIDAQIWYRLALKADPAAELPRRELKRIEAKLAGQDPSSARDPGGELWLSALAAWAGKAGELRGAAVGDGRVNSGSRAVDAGARVAGAGLLLTAAAEGTVRFVDEAPGSGLDFVYNNGESLIHQIPETTGGGVGLLDYDRDGWIDLFVVQGGSFPPRADSRRTPGDRLFRNRGAGRFEDVTERAGLDRLPVGYGHGVAVADYDNDGYPDLFLTRWRSYLLLRNRGDGTFDDVTERAGLGGERGWPTSAAFADLDGDGDLDLYVCHYGEWDAENPKLCREKTSGAYISCNPLELLAQPDRLYRNDGGTFVDVTEAAGVLETEGRGLGVVAADLDDDGRIDLFVANDLSANYLWRNLGNWQFEEVGHAAGVAGNAAGGYQASMGIAAGDLDGDGRIDLAVTNFYGECTTYYRNLGGGAFSDGTAEFGLDVATRRLLGFGIVCFDADNDGRLDLATANGHVNDLRPHFPYLMPAQLLLGTDRRRLVDPGGAAGEVWSVPRMGRALAAGDLDNDGRVDLVLVSHNQPLADLRNRSTGGRFVTLQLEGKLGASNRDAIGARVTVAAGSRSWVGIRAGGGSYQSSSDPRLHFGVGGAERIDALEVAWPSGRVDRYGSLETNAAYWIREGAERPVPLPGFPPSKNSDATAAGR